MNAVDLTRIFDCLCDETRLRMVALLLEGPLCVCHFQEILEISQVKSSRHLAYLRQHGLVEVTKNANWRIYRIPEKIDPLLAHQLDCLRESVRQVPELKRDRKARKRIESDIATSTACCA
jgi:ArsR family transcriptional regulator, arsenate/arsenite/antimonite-responsive transcriptional repressor